MPIDKAGKSNEGGGGEGGGGWWRIREFANSYCCVFFILIGIAQPLMVVWLVGSFEGLGSLVPKAC